MRLMATYTYVSRDIKENALSITIATCRNISGNTQTISLVTIQFLDLLLAIIGKQV